MAVLKKYNPDTESWEVTVVGERGDPGIIYSETPPDDTGAIWYDESETAPNLEEVIRKALQTTLASETIVTTTSHTLTIDHANGIVIYTADEDILVSIDDTGLLSRSTFQIVQDGQGTVILDIPSADRRGGDRTPGQFESIQVYLREDGIYQITGAVEA